MTDETPDPSPTLADVRGAVGSDLLADLTREAPDDERQQRSHERVSLQTAVRVRPGDASRALEPAVVGQTENLSRGGCLLTLEHPTGVGDVFRIEFPEADIDTTFARCLRCRLLNDTTFEAAFRFFSPIYVPKPAA